MEFLPDGRTRIGLGAGREPIELGLPNWGQFKEFRLASVDLGEESTRLAIEAAELPEGSDERRAAFRAADEKAETLVVDWWRMVVSGIGKGQLPDDVNDWPVELIAGRRIIPLIEHWKNVPLDRGAETPT